MPKQTFEQWLNKVHKYLDFIGLSIHDIPDCPYRDWYDDGVQPNSAARKAVKYADSFFY